MSNNHFKYGEAFQKKVLSMLVLDPENVLPVVEPSYFAFPMLAEIALIVHQAYRDQDLRQSRLTRATLWTLVQEKLRSKNDEKRSELKPSYKKTVRDLFQIAQSDKAIALKEVAKFARETRFRDALVTSEKFVNAGNYEAAKTAMQEADRHEGTGEAQDFRLPIHEIHHFIRDNHLSEDRKNYLVYPIVPKAGAILLFGLPKELKSWMAAALAVDAASGRKALGYFDVPRRVKTLYVQVEDTAVHTQARLRALYDNQGDNKPVGMLHVIPRCGLNLTEPKWIEQLALAIERLKPELLIFDVLRRLFRGNVSDSEQTAKFLEVLDTFRDKHGCAEMMVHHAKKTEAAEIQAQALGSVYLAAWADVLLYTHSKRSLADMTVAKLTVETKSGTVEKNHLSVAVSEKNWPMVSVGEESMFERNYLLSCIEENPGLNQQQLQQVSGIAEKRQRDVLKMAVEERLIKVTHGRRKELFYYPVERDAD